MWYNALQLGINKRLSRGLTFDLYYTFSRGMQYHNADNAYVRDSVTQDFNNLAGSVGPKVTDVQHRFQMVQSYAIPTPGFAAGSSFGRGLFGGWTVQGIIGARSAFPLNVVQGRDVVGNGRADGQRPDAINGANPYVTSSDVLLRLTATAYDADTPRLQRRFGTLGYNTVRGTSQFTWDASLHKIFQINEQHRITFRFEAFNWMNHTVFGNPSTSLADANFGRITAVAVDPRNIQFGLKYGF
jgi:hypothetical protein